MYIKFSVILLVIQLTSGQIENKHWDVAVIVDNHIELLLENGTSIGHTSKLSSKLKALTFDNVRHQFVVSDQTQSIVNIKLTEKTHQEIFGNLTDNINGLAIDPITDTLYWTDSENQSIKYVRLNETPAQSDIFLSLEDERPQDIAIDICNRYIYWTNLNVMNSTIERCRLDGSDHEVVIQNDLIMPAGIAIDYYSNRLYWGDREEGLYYSIKSSNTDGTDIKTIYSSTHSRPLNIAVDANYIYWTDPNNRAVWRISKYSKEASIERFGVFHQDPRGVLTKNVEVRTLPECRNLAIAETAYNESTKEIFEEATSAEMDLVPKCLNGGDLNEDDSCECPQGYSGERCEISLCYNYCVNGDCAVSSSGYLSCKCPKFFEGFRCERDLCDGFCLNEGTCNRSSHSKSPTCNCPEGFTGRRCEARTNRCDSFCRERKYEFLISENDKIVCKCMNGFAVGVEVDEEKEFNLPLMQKHSSFDFQDNFLLMIAVVVVLLLIIVMLSVYVCTLKKRPRIKKRIIVNRNVTPLTYRPQPPPDQCEITIENCCNMNICETPCFEPSQLRCLQAKHDDKKKLLANMENEDGVDLY